MSPRTGAGLLLVAVLACPPAAAQTRAIPPSELRSGTAFLSADLKAQQEDEFANPGMLWVERGARAWEEPVGAARKSCADCHGDAGRSMRGVAARHPTLDAAGTLVNTADRIRACRASRQRAEPPAWESDELLGLVAYVARQSKGMPLAPTIEGAARPHFERGRALYYRRIGQLNLACAHCHERNWGRRLFAETISQGQPNAYPAYRLEWQTAGSLERRLRACLSGVRAEMLPYGAPEYRELELFLAWRGAGLPVETPGVRR